MSSNDLVTRATPFLRYLEEWFEGLPDATLASVVGERPERVAVISVDMINGFCHFGPLASDLRAKLDPAIRFGGFGPWRPDWSLEKLKTITVPMLGFMATVEEEMGWGTKREALLPYMPPGAELISFEDTGHFIHIEHPRRVADQVLDFLG